MPRYKPQDHNSLLLPVVLSEQIILGSFTFALNYLVDQELDLTPLDAKFKNDEVGGWNSPRRTLSGSVPAASLQLGALLRSPAERSAVLAAAP